MSRNIVVTGGAGGIGSEICQGLAADGFGNACRRRPVNGLAVFQCRATDRTHRKAPCRDAWLFVAAIPSPLS